MSLRRLYNLREMSVNVPDTDVPALKKVVQQAVLNGELPGEAAAWFPKGKSSSGKAAEPTTSSEPKAKGKGGKAKAKAEPEAPKSVPLSPDARSQLDKGQSAWDKLANAGDARQKAEPTKGKAKAEPEFDPTNHDVGGDYGAQFPQFDQPKSANVRLNKQGQPMKDVEPGQPDFSDMGKKPGALSRLFGKSKKDDSDSVVAQPKKGSLSRIFGKKQQQFSDNPYEMDPQTSQGPDWSGYGDPHAVPPAPKKEPHKSDDGEPEEPTGGGDDAMADLGSFLDKNPAGAAGKKAMGGLKRDLAASPKDSSKGGDSAMTDLKWDLDRTNRERMKKK